MERQTPRHPERDSCYGGKNFMEERRKRRRKGSNGENTWEKRKRHLKGYLGKLKVVY